MKKSHFKIPHVYIILMLIAFVFAVLTYVIPAGSYEMEKVEVNKVERSIIKADTFQYVEQTPVNLMEYLSAIPIGMQQAAQISFFIFIVGGAFAVVRKTEAIEAGLGRVAKKLKGKEIFMIPIATLMFALSSAMIGNYEENLPFIPIFVSLFLAIGYDSILGTAVVLCGAGAGFAGAIMNPFTVGVSQGIAGLPLFSGLGLRIALFIALQVLTIGYLIRYAYKIRKKPELSPMYEDDKQREDSMDLEAIPELTGRRKLILLVFLLTLILLVYGVIHFSWYINQIAGLFIGMSIVVACIYGMGFDGYAKALQEGFRDIAVGALIVGFARAILVVMQEGNILHTILYVVSNMLQKTNSMVSAVCAYLFQTLTNYLIPSGTGQAAVTMPIMAPLGDLTGVTRQTMCLAFQIGDGITNVFTPTAGTLMAALALVKIPWTKWAKWIFPLILMQQLVGLIFIIIAHSIQFGPY